MPVKSEVTVGPPLGRDSPVEVELDAFPARKLEIWGSRGIGLYISFPNCGTNLRTETCLYTKSARSGGAWGGGKEGQRGDTGGVYSGGAHRATSNGVLMSMCELVASQINTLRELGSCEHAPARRSLR